MCETHRRFRPLLASVLLVLALDATAGAQEPSAPTYPLPGPEAAAVAVDEFVQALNRADTAAVAGLFTRGAEAYERPVGEKGFARVGWLPHPWQRHLIHAFRAPAFPRGGSLRVTVTERMVSGSFVFQRERIRSRVGGKPLAGFTWSVLYGVRGHRIDEVWYLGPESDPLDSVSILVIANAAPAGKTRGPAPDQSATAFTGQEVAALTDWVARGGRLQGGVRDFGEGRVALFGEVWMLRYLDVDNPQLEGAQNSRFILNLMRWLSTRSGP